MRQALSISDLLDGSERALLMDSRNESENLIPVARLREKRKSTSAGQLVAVEFQSVQIAEDGHRNRFGAEKLVGQLFQLFHRHALDLLQQFIHGEKAVEIHFLPSEVGHA